MKREEEIELAWRKKAAQSNHQYDEKSFKEAVEWADKYPKLYNQDELCDIQLEMMKQRDKRLIAKACEWLKENIDIYAKVVINHKSNYPEIVMCDTFEKNFIKAMER